MSALLLATFLLAGVAATRTAQAQAYTVLYNFGGVPGDPECIGSPGVVAQGRDGNLYTTSVCGGTSGAGTGFKITTQGTLTVLYNFGSDSWTGGSTSGLTLGTDGYFYGTGGGVNNDGTVFRLSPTGQLDTLYVFNVNGEDGAGPAGPPIEGVDGVLYGTTYSGGSPPSFWGTIYKLTPTGEFTSLYQFDGTQGSRPDAALIQGKDGNFYGTTSSDGLCSNCGSVFKITPAGVLTTLHFFDGSDGNEPEASLIQARDGNFYGTTWAGGENNDGVVFTLTTAGAYSVIHSFDGTDGDILRAGLVQASDGRFYGTTWLGGKDYAGTIFRLSLQGDFSELYNFNGLTGNQPMVALCQHTNGLLYGETNIGGTYDGGVFFSLDVGARPFVRLMPFAGRVGKGVEFLGQGFTGTTGVAFNGVPASFVVRSDTFLTATVPAGATTGYVTVTTSTSTLKSKQRFFVKQ
jgi:uncharacterized repeat protein (TIGR03803 family)